MITKSIFLIGLITILFSCSNDGPKTPKVDFTSIQTNANGDTTMIITEKGKQGRWTYTLSNGTVTDTIYKDGVPQ